MKEKEKRKKRHVETHLEGAECDNGDGAHQAPREFRLHLFIREHSKIIRARRDVKFFEKVR